MPKGQSTNSGFRKSIPYRSQATFGFMDEDGSAKRPVRLSGFPATPCREDAFDRITEDSSYWIGFLLADGYISDQSVGARKIVVKLQARDEEHLIAFRSFLGSNHTIYRRLARAQRDSEPKPQVVISISSNRLTEALAGYGVTPRKSLTARVIGLEMDRDFWRGVIDGDGSLCFNKRSPMLSLVGSHDTIVQFKDFVLHYCPTFGSNPQLRGKVSVISMQNSHAWDIVKVLYDGCKTALPRKREMADKILAGPRPKLYRKRSHLTLEALEDMLLRLDSWRSVASELGITTKALSGMLWYLRRKSKQTIPADSSGIIES